MAEMKGTKVECNREKITPSLLTNHARMFKENFSQIYIQSVTLGEVEKWLKSKIKAYSASYRVYALYGDLIDRPEQQSFISMALVEPVAQHMLNACVACEDVKPDHELMMKFAIEEEVRLREALKDALVKVEMLEDQVAFLKSKEVKA